MPEAERALRYAQLLALAAETFGSLSEAKAWMRERNHALGGETPLRLSETDPGAEIVRDLLTGLQHGHPV
jgi:putative toxin-antitoxin system antitoxin component (TIGR02293 family)